MEIVLRTCKRHIVVDDYNHMCVVCLKTRPFEDGEIEYFGSLCGFCNKAWTGWIRLQKEHYLYHYCDAEGTYVAWCTIDTEDSGHTELGSHDRRTSSQGERPKPKEVSK